MSDKKTIGAGWKKVTEKGKYIALSFNASEIEGLDLANCWVSLVVNNRKQKDTHPDFNILASPKTGTKAPPKLKPEEDPFGF